MGNIILGDCLELLKTFEDSSVDSIVTDPPYGLKFMAKKWDYDVPSVEIWKECFRVLKPGGHLLSFGGTRTYHRLVVNIEDAGFEIRDMIQWLYGSGFPKNHDIGKAIDKQLGAEREVVGTVKRWGANASGGRGNQRANDYQPSEKGAVKYDEVTVPGSEEAKKWDGFGTALKPANEPICCARKPLSEKTIAANVLKHGTGGLNIDGCRVETADWDAKAMERVNTPGSGQLKGRDPILASRGNKGSDNAAKPMDTTKGRWPANVIHDGSQMVLDLFPRAKTGGSGVTKENHNGCTMSGPASNKTRKTIGYNDDGSAVRFFYCAKCSKKDRGVGNNHPTVKPTDLMKYLVRLVTPPGGAVLDPFMGSGSTGKACILEGFDFIGIEKDEKYFEIAKSRIQEALKEIF